jgi:hypothetical protein
MRVDLHQDFKDIYSYVVRRVRAFDPATNRGPGDGESPVSQIDFGFQCDQAGWVALVFDTRPDAEPDGQWNAYIVDNTLERKSWRAACESLEMMPVDFVLHDGSRRRILSADHEEEFIRVFGDLLKSVLLKARADGVFRSLPKAQVCHLGVEEMDGRYAWPRYEDRGKDDLA